MTSFLLFANIFIRSFLFNRKKNIILFYGLTSWKKLLYLKDAVGICYRTRDHVHGIQEGNIGICIHQGRSQQVAKSTCPSQKLFYIAQQGGLDVFAGVVVSSLFSCVFSMTAAAGHRKCVI